MSKLLAAIENEPDFELPEVFQEKEEEPDDIEVTPTLVAVTALCLAIVTLLQSVVATARVEVDVQLSTCGDAGTSGWMSSSFTPTPISSIPGMNFTTGIVKAPGGQTLGYTIAADGAKEFILIAQPISQVIMKMSDLPINSNLTNSTTLTNSTLTNSTLTNSTYPIFSPFYQIDPTTEVITNPAGTTPAGFGSLTYNYTANVWGYNGYFPGPIIEVMKGDTIRIKFSNELPEPTTLHVDGFIHDWEDDGTGGVSELPLAPQSQRIYQFTNIQQCGNFLYHSGFQTWKQDLRGLYGHFIVRCPLVEPKVNWDYSIIASGLVVFTDTSATACKGWWLPKINWWLFNGHASPSVPPLKANAGDIVRLRFINPTIDQLDSIHLHGHEWTQISSGGAVYTGANTILNSKGSTISLPAGVAKDVIFTARAGIWRLHCQTAEHTINNQAAYSWSPLQLAPDGGMNTFLCVAGTTDQNTTITCNF